MIAGLVPGSWDFEGREVSQPRLRHGFRPTFPMTSYLTQPLSVRCKTLEEIRAFLLRCRYVSDKELDPSGDYWAPPEEFEQSRRGDCDCFALWTWRQLLEMGYEARFMVGTAGRHPGRHAWVTFCRDGAWYALEPTSAPIGMTMPRLGTLFYAPDLSAGWDGHRIHFYEHQPVRYKPPAPLLAMLIAENAASNVRAVGLLCWLLARGIARWVVGRMRRRQ